MRCKLSKFNYTLHPNIFYQHDDCCLKRCDTIRYAIRNIQTRTLKNTIRDDDVDDGVELDKTKKIKKISSPWLWKSISIVIVWLTLKYCLGSLKYLWTNAMLIRLRRNGKYNKRLKWLQANDVKWMKCSIQLKLKNGKIFLRFT